MPDNTIRTLAIDAIQKAKSGHPGTPMDMAPVAYGLWQKRLNSDPADPIWPNRDRFILSAGRLRMDRPRTNVRVRSRSHHSSPNVHGPSQYSASIADPPVLSVHRPIAADVAPSQIGGMPYHRFKVGQTVVAPSEGRDLHISRGPLVVVRLLTNGCALERGVSFPPTADMPSHTSGAAMCQQQKCRSVCWQPVSSRQARNFEFELVLSAFVATALQCNLIRLPPR